jgi:hypothetical protein
VDEEIGGCGKACAHTVFDEKLATLGNSFSYFRLGKVVKQKGEESVFVVLASLRFVPFCCFLFVDMEQPLTDYCWSLDWHADAGVCETVGDGRHGAVETLGAKGSTGVEKQLTHFKDAIPGDGMG